MLFSVKAFDVVFLSEQQDPLVQMVKLFSCLSFDSASCHTQRKPAQVSVIHSDIPASFSVMNICSPSDFQLWVIQSNRMTVMRTGLQGKFLWAKYIIPYTTTKCADCSAL